MKTQKTMAAIFTAFLLVSASCEKNSAEATNNGFAPFLITSADGTSFIDGEKMLNFLTYTPDLSNDELKLLVSMRDEEKLAMDVYSALGKKWGHQVFSRISSAENTHMSAVNSLLKYYGSADTVISDPGVFPDGRVQDLYNELVLKGSASLDDAFKTGALIEEMDIKDLRDAIDQTSNENIIMVFSNLERGSKNHLRAFNRQLTVRGTSYTPVYLSQEDYNNIVSSPVEAGNQYRMNQKGQHHRRGKW